MKIPRLGRTTTEVATHPWPVVTKGCLSEKPGNDWAPLKRLLVEGLQHLKEVELRLKRLELEKGPVSLQALKMRLLVEKVQEEWPLTVV